MKKILTLIFAAGAMTAAVAQSHKNDHYNNGRDDHYNNGKYDQGNNRYDDKRYDARYDFAVKERDQQIERINRQFNFQIRDIENDRHLRRNQKRKMIERLEDQRSHEIRAVYARFSDKRNRYSAPYAYNDRH